MGRHGWLFASVFALLFVDASSARAFGRKPSPPTPQPPVSAPAAHGSYQLRLLAYNVQGLPFGMGGDNDRFMDIGLILRERRNQGTAPHIVAIEEGFVNEADDIAKFSGYPYVVRGPTAATGKIIGSGLIILSEYPITSHSMTKYAECIGFDCYSTKGAHHVRVKIPDLPDEVELVNTHLNADAESSLVSEEQTIAIRIAQMKELDTFRKQAARPKAAVFTIGDFNFHPGHSDYDGYVARSGLTNATEYCATRSNTCSGDNNSLDDWHKSYDHQFYASGNWVQVTPIHFERNFRDKVRGRDLSDHYGLEVHYQLNW